MNQLWHIALTVIGPGPLGQCVVKLEQYSLRPFRWARHRRPFYRQKAKECAANAKTSRDPEAVEAWLELAEMWTELAEDREPGGSSVH